MVNDRGEPLAGELELALYRAATSQVASARRAVAVEAARGAIELGAAALFDGFLDLSYAYRFGPPSHDLVVATAARAVGRARWRRRSTSRSGCRRARARRRADRDGALDGGGATVTVRTRRFAQAIAVEADGFVADDAYFHLPPGGEHTFRLRRVGEVATLRGTLQPLNAAASAKIVVA